MSLRVHPGLAPLGVVASLAQRIEPCLSRVGQVERVRLPQGVLAEKMGVVAYLSGYHFCHTRLRHAGESKRT